MSDNTESGPTIGIPDGITAEDVHRAIAAYREGTAKHQFRDSTGYDLMYNGSAYPPKAVVGLAATRLLGRVLTPAEFSGGDSSKCFAVLRDLGFNIVPKPSSPDSAE